MNATEKKAGILRKLLPATLLATALVVLAVGSLYLKTAWPIDSLSLTTTAGNTGALSGFNLTGAYSDYRSVNTFTLHNGVLTEQHCMGREAEKIGAVPAYNSYSFSEWYVATAEHAAVDAAAEISGLNNSVPSVSCRSTATQFCGVGTVYLGDDENSSLRFVAQEYTVKTPVEVMANYYEYPNKPNYYDYTPTGVDDFTNAPGARALINRGPTNQQYFALRQSCLAGAAGIYRVTESLTDAEVEALPTNATISGKPILAGATSYGSYTAFYTLPEGVMLKDYQFLQGGCCLLTEKDGELTLLYVDETGALQDSRALGSLNSNPNGTGRDATFLAARSTNSTTCGLYLPVNGQELAAAFAVENNAITAWQQQPRASGTEGRPLLAAMLNPDHTRMLTIYGTYSYERISTGDVPVTFDDALLRVYKSGSEVPVYEGVLNAGLSRDFANHVKYNIVTPSRNMWLNTPNGRLYV